MNIEIANRLVNLRKANNLSQEALAEKLGKLKKVEYLEMSTVGREI